MPSWGRSADLAWAVIFGLTCHISFLAAVAVMMGEMLFGMSRSMGGLAAPWSLAANGVLLLQFPVLHSLLLTRQGQAALRRVAPKTLGSKLITTTYATLAAWQTLALFLLWSPSGVVWWRATGPAWVGLCALNGAAWLFLLRAIWDAGWELQVGFLGWWAVARGRAPVYPPLPRQGLFRWCRQPIYLGFALTVWTVPTWTPDQLAVALVLTGYCLLGPLLKEARFKARHGEAFAAYQASTPYWLPWPRPRPRV